MVGQAEAAWLTGYSYRKKITITGQAGAGTYYQVKLLVGESSGATGENFDLNSRCSSFPNDIRFTDNDGNTLLDYWVESTTGTTPNQLTTVWIEVADSLESGTVDIYVYYGKSGGTSASNFDNTFTKDYGESGLVGLWHMDEGSGTTIADSSGNGNTGNFKAAGEPAWAGSDGGQWDNRSDVNFSTGNALTFDGNE